MRLQDLPIILVEDDDQLIQCLVERTLGDAGFEAAIAASGKEAVNLLKEHKKKYCALVTDINLRGTMGGFRVAQHARQIDPPVVYMSGGCRFGLGV